MTRPSFIQECDWKLLVKKYREDELVGVIQRIENDYPVQYAIGDVEFLKNKILVDESVLIPRYETELLTYNLIKMIKERGLEESNMIDLCTGSGCIAISLKKEFPKSTVFAVDVSDSALELAKKNAALNGVNINFLKKDLLKTSDFSTTISILVSNPPYVKRDEEVSKNTKYEPSIALYPGDDDIIFYKKILDFAPDIMAKENIIAFEIGSTQAGRICDYARHIYPNAKIVVEKDYNDYDRFVYIFNNFE